MSANDVEQLSLIGDSHLEAGPDNKVRISPKRPSVERDGLADVFPYYAGFSYRFAIAELRRSVATDPSTLVLDPWNGSGTTTQAARDLNLRSVGIDLNPVANIVAAVRARASSRDLVDKFTRASTAVEIGQCHPLSHWLDDESVLEVQRWIQAARDLGAQTENGYQIAMVAIFRAVRKLTKSFQGSNPTWIRRAKSDLDRLDIRDRVGGLIRSEYDVLRKRLTENSLEHRHHAALATASSANLPLPDSVVGATLTSPPYLTRIDYGVAYSRELAALGIDIWADSIRKDLMGTTLTRAGRGSARKLGTLAKLLVTSISEHESKASSNYYSNQAQQYLSDLSLGLDEITRVSRESADLTLVVQDSYYKDVHVRLADICADELMARGWEVVEIKPFEVRRSLVDLNTNARAYVKGTVSESVLQLRLAQRRARADGDRPEAACPGRPAPEAPLEQVEKL
ncbi:DNA methyltransferase [Pseudonocardia xishanensis]|uniref:site-specific DNA-methyltransferase (cytosine-N(4)-specific) n=1 Tax=Pseudonocardia xishanensis TaxID=630995 RepID=A0ABP8RPI8_9PSEU